MSSISSAASFKSATSIKSTTSTTSVKSARSVAATSTVSRSSTILRSPAFKVASDLADEFHALVRDLDQARATADNVRKLANTNSFRVVDWAALEGTWPLDHEDVLGKLEAEIVAKIPVFEVAKERLEDALALLDEVEHRAWWLQCTLKYSCMECFAGYKPLDLDDTEAEESSEEDEASENDDSPREVRFEEPDLFWLAEEDKEGREIVAQYYREVREAAN